MDDSKPAEVSSKLAALPAPAAATNRAQHPSRNRRFIPKCLVFCIVLIFAFSTIRRWSDESRSMTEVSIGKTSHRGQIIGREAEELFLSIPNTASAIAASREYATKPHRAGSAGDLETAKAFLALLQKELDIDVPLSEPIFSAGTFASRNATLSIPKLDSPQAWIDIYYPFMNTPLDRSLEIVDDDDRPVWKANLEEVADDTDADAGQYFDAVPAFHGLSRDGEATGKLVYANYGRQEDYKALVDKGVNFNSTIVIVRYGGIFRGLKVKGAEELGAAAVLIYSDPRDDGTVTTKNGYLPYPFGPARNPASLQRGSVSYVSMYPGDPTTPGYPSYENSTRTEGKNYPSIPSLPISWANAEVLLKEISDGGLGRTVKLVNHVDNRIIPIWNTMSVIPGHIKNEVVVIGNHRDAWVLGATDPTSGTVSVHEVIRGFGALLKKGWKPLRTILLASWDAEEYALIGSTEWGEDFTDFIDKHVVAYLNLDSSVSGSRFHVSSSPSLAHLLRETAQRVPHPTDSKRTLWDAASDTGTLFGDHLDPEALAIYEAEIQNADAVGVSPLGSGSDYTVFLQRIGVASTNGGFGSTLHDPVYHYHSVFDSERWQELYGDPGFTRHVAIARHLGLLALRLSNDIILPLNTTHYSFELEAYLDEVETIASEFSLDADLLALRESIKSLQNTSIKLDYHKNKAGKKLERIIKKWRKRRSWRCRIRHAVRNITCSLMKFFGRDAQHLCPHNHQQDPHVSHINPSGGVKVKPRIGRYPAWLREQQEELETQALAYMQLGAMDDRRRSPRKKLVEAVKRVQAINQKLIAFERGFISEDGIKDREWFKHLGVAPGKWLGYGATPLPALTESLTIEKNATLAKYEAKRLKDLIDHLEKQIRI